MLFRVRSNASVLIRLAVILLLVLSLCGAQHYNSRNGHPYDDYDDQDGAVETDNELESRAPPVYRPVPVQPPPPSTQPDVVVVPRLGLLRGKIAYKTIRNRPVNAFLGIRYGVVGTGLARFQRANVPRSNSNAIIEATEEPAKCPQFPDLKKIFAAEARGENVDDCLTLNVHAPARPGSFPVMVFIHGEMLFDGGADEAQPDYFLEQDVVLVSVNYRLAPFGFLTTLTDDMPGNVALADIQMALEWVQQYIRPLGGNPEQVTLFGQAGGASLVHALTLTDKAQGLFHKVILQSGTALSPFFLELDALSTARSFARTARCARSGLQELQNLNSCFERLSTTELLETMKRHWDENEPRGLHYMGGFKLSVGDKLGYLPQHPAALVANRTVPMIVGVTKDAGAFLMSSFYDELARLRTRNASDYINVVLRHTANPRHYMVWKNLALREIFNEADLANPTLPKLAQGLLELINLILYRGPVLDTIRQTYRKAPTYLYCFDYRGEFHRFGHLENPLPFEADATLSDDNIYLFPYPDEVSRLNPQDRTLSRALIIMWVNFAQYGIPNVNPGVWPNVTTEFGPFLRFTNSKETALELDYHFGDGIAVPNLYAEYLTPITTTTTRRPYPNLPSHPNYPSNYPSRPSYSNYPNYPANYPAPNYANQQSYPNYPNYRAHETVLNEHTPSNGNDHNSQYAPYVNRQ